MKHLTAILASIISLFTVLGTVQAQNAAQTKKIDSLAKALADGAALDDSARLALRIQLASEYVYLKPDSAKKMIREILPALPQKWPGLLFAAQHGIAIAYWQSASPDSSIILMAKALETASRTGALDSARAMHGIGIVYYDKGDYKEASGRIFYALKVYEQAGKEDLTARACNDLGLVFSDQELYAEAEKYHRKNMALSLKIGLKMMVMGAYNNIGLIKLNTGQYDSAVFYFGEALVYNGKHLKHRQGESLFLGNIAEALIKQKKYDEAAVYAVRSFEEAEEAGYKRMIAQSGSILGMIRYEQGKYAEAVPLLEKGTQMSLGIGMSKEASGAFEYLHRAYSKTGRYEKAYKAYNDFVLLRDSLSKMDNMKDLLKKESDAKTEKMAAEQEKQRIENEAELDRQKLMRNGTAAVLGLALLLVFFVFRSYRIKQKANRILALRNEEISAQKEEILQSLETVAQQKEVIAQTNENLIQQHEELMVLNENIDKQKGQLESTYTDLKHTSEQLEKSIRYASHIQDVVLPEISEMKSFFGDAFILYMPKDVVSGDFYWFSQINAAKAVFAMADCTGHGVPGAFMSMLGATLLHETVNVKGVNGDPARILRNLHSGLRKILRQEQGKNDDGMDISIGVFEKNTLLGGASLVYAGAKASACVVSEMGIREIKGDNQYIGGKPLKRPFENQELVLPKNSSVYFYTDGFADQNNADRQKFGSSRFKETLANLAGLPFETQKNTLAEALEAHKKGEAQRDDISVVGFVCR